MRACVRACVCVCACVCVHVCVRACVRFVSSVDTPRHPAPSSVLCRHRCCVCRSSVLRDPNKQTLSTDCDHSHSHLQWGFLTLFPPPPPKELYSTHFVRKVTPLASSGFGRLDVCVAYEQHAASFRTSLRLTHRQYRTFVCGAVRYGAVLLRRVWPLTFDRCTCMSTAGRRVVRVLGFGVRVVFSSIAAAQY